MDRGQRFQGKRFPPQNPNRDNRNINGKGNSHSTPHDDQVHDPRRYTDDYRAPKRRHYDHEYYEGSSRYSNGRNTQNQRSNAPPQPSSGRGAPSSSASEGNRTNVPPRQYSGQSQTIRGHNYANNTNINTDKHEVLEKKVPTGPKGRGFNALDHPNKLYPPRSNTDRGGYGQSNHAFHESSIRGRGGRGKPSFLKSGKPNTRNIIDRSNNTNHQRSFTDNRHDSEARGNNNFQFMKDLKIPGIIYDRVQQVGEGTYGKVYKAKNKVTGRLVALKRLRLESEREGFPITASREIGLLQSFDHANVVGLDEMMLEKGSVIMVFPYMNHDLSGILQQQNIVITDGERKNIFHQLLEGINYLHSKRVIHRDIKGSNILLDNKGVLKITDFGLARTMKVLNKSTESPNYTNRVITLWYRPPEILLGSTDYGREIDIWGIGCLLLELFTRRPVFQGIDEIDQLWKVYDIMGTITIDSWPEADRLPWFEMLRPELHSESHFKSHFGNLLSPQTFDLASKLLELNPNRRITAENALKHEYFKEEPLQTPLSFLSTVSGEWHEFEAKKQRKSRELRKKIA